MSCYAVRYTKAARKFMTKHKPVGLRFMKAFDEIADDRQAVHWYDVVSIRGRDGLFRLRIGKYRAIFKVDDNDMLIVVAVIDSRGDVYKNL